MWLGTFAAFCGFGGFVLEIFGLLGFIQVDYSKSQIAPGIDLIAKLPLIILLVVSVYGFFKRAKWSRVSALIFWPFIGSYSLFKEGWANELTLATIIGIVIYSATLTVLAWYYFYKKNDVVTYFSSRNT